MNKIEYHTQEEKEACDLIRQKRLYARTHFIRKGITIFVGYENGKVIGSQLRISCNKVTGHIQFDHSLHYLNKSIYPSKNTPLKCTNQHAIDALRLSKHRAKKFSKSAIIIDFSERLEKYINLYDRLIYYKDSGNVAWSSAFTTSNNVKLKIIDEFNYL